LESQYKRRLRALEEQAQPKQTIIGVVDVRDLPASEATARINAKRAELDRRGAPATLIILKHQERDKV
jgi:hypothetical protein